MYKHILASHMSTSNWWMLAEADYIRVAKTCYPDTGWGARLWGYHIWQTYWCTDWVCKPWWYQPPPPPVSTVTTLCLVIYTHLLSVCVEQWQVIAWRHLQDLHARDSGLVKEQSRLQWFQNSFSKILLLRLVHVYIYVSCDINTTVCHEHCIPFYLIVSGNL